MTVTNTTVRDSTSHKSCTCTILHYWLDCHCTHMHMPDACTVTSHDQITSAASSHYYLLLLGSAQPDTLSLVVRAVTSQLSKLADHIIITVHVHVLALGRLANTGRVSCHDLTCLWKLH
eukprot:scpid20866/ scgid27731/ 